MFGLSTKDVVLLKQAAPMNVEYAKRGCTYKNSGGMEEWAKKNNVAVDLSCEWYHSTWQYLRLINMVAVPNWYEFYNDAISKALREHVKPKVFISACADYGMLAKLHESIIETGVMPEIIIQDICETPLLSCRWYANKYGLDIVCRAEDIITNDIPERPFDLIITDEFLTVLKDPDKPTIVQKWHDLLKNGGTVITTAMMGEVTTQEKRDYYFNKAVHLYRENKKMMFPFINTCEQEDDLLNKFRCFANIHTRHMLKDESVLKELFKMFNDVEYSVTITPGECVNPTPSCQICAIK